MEGIKLCLFQINQHGHYFDGHMLRDQDVSNYLRVTTGQESDSYIFAEGQYIGTYQDLVKMAQMVRSGNAPYAQS